MPSLRIKKGFTLVEAVIAGAIFLMLIVGFTSAYLLNLKTQKMAIRHFEANCLARNRIQRGLSLDYTSLWGLAETNRMVTADGYANPTGTFMRTTIIDSNYLTNCTRIVVRVWYPAPVGRLSDEPVEISTVISRHMLE